MDIMGLFTKHTKLLQVGFLVLLLIFIITLPLYGRTFHINLMNLILMYIILSVSWVMFSGSTGYMSLAPAAFVGTGMYSVALLQRTLPFPVILVIACILCFMLALILGLVTLRLKGIYFAIFSFGLVVFMTEVIKYLEGVITGARGQHIDPLPRTTLYYIMLGLTIVTVLAVYYIRRSRWGLAMQSIGGSEEAAEHMGVNTTMTKVLTFAISATFMGAVGAITAPRLIYINAETAFSLMNSFIPILVAVFGGMGQFYGPIVGAFVFGFLDRMLRDQIGQYFLLAFGIILVLVIVFLPDGIVGLGPVLKQRLGRLRARLRKGGKAEQHANT